MLTTIKEWFLALSRTARAGFIAGACIIVALFVSLSYWALSTDYQILFAELDPQDGGAIISELDRMKVPYQLKDDGKTILVEQSQVYKTRLKLMGKGVNLKGTVGFEIFNESDFGMTDFAQRINYQRALQGEIARTIMGLEEVQSARVHLVVPESGFLKKGEKQTKASITITTKPGHKLAQDQVLGIQRLVAAAVPEIDISGVTILDSRGVALTKSVDKEQEEAKSLESKLAVKQQTEEYFTQKVVAILDKTFGPGKAIVSVDVTLNHDSLKVTREDVLPAQTPRGDADGAVTRKKKHSKRQGQSKKSAATQSSSQADTYAENSMPTESTEEVEYQHGRKIEQLISNPGSIKRLSVGVILPSNVDSDKIEMLTKVISMSVGLNSTRGDALAVYPLDRFVAKDTSDQGTVNRSVNAAGISTRPAAEGPAVSGSAKDTNLYFLTSIAVFLGLALLLFWAIKNRKPLNPRLNQDEREKMLKDIQAWLVQPHDHTARNA